MSSRPPSCAELDGAINESTGFQGTQIRARPLRESRQTEKAQYITGQRRERELQRQKTKTKTVTTQRIQENRAPNEVGHTVITSRDVELNTSKNNLTLDLRPQSGRVPPLSVPVKLKGISSGIDGSHRHKDIMTQQPSGFIQGPFGHNVAPQAKARVTEHVRERRVLCPASPPLDEDEGLDTLSEFSDHEGDEDTSAGFEDTGAIFQRRASNESHRVHRHIDTGGESGEDDLESMHTPRKRDREYDVGGDESENEDLDSSNPRQKRARSSVGCDNAQDHTQDPDANRKPQKIRASKGRTAARDYEVAVQQILKVAIALFHSRITAEYAYPDRITQVQWAKEVWAEGCDECNMQIGFDNEIIQLITNRTWHLTGELKLKIRPLTEVMYGFENSTKPAIQARNRKLVEDLLEDFGVCYRSLGDPDNGIPCQGLYENKIIQKAINICFYNNKKDKGVLFPKYFQPFPMAGMALVLTAMEACIDEWSSGERCDVPFNERIFKPVYENHLSQLKKFEALTKDHGIMAKLLKRLDDNGRRHAKVETAADKPQTRVLQGDAIAAAIREFEMRNGNFSDGDE